MYFGEERLLDESMSSGRTGRKSCVSSAYRWWFKERDEIKVLRGDAYMMKGRGPRTESWGTPHNQAHEEEKYLPHLTRKVPDDN